MKIKRKKRGKSKRSRQKAGTFFSLLSSSCSQYMVEVCVCVSVYVPHTFSSKPIKARFIFLAKAIAKWNAIDRNPNQLTNWKRSVIEDRAKRNIEEERGRDSLPENSRETLNDRKDIEWQGPLVEGGKKDKGYQVDKERETNRGIKKDTEK